MEFDIRTNEPEEITILRFADDIRYHASGISRSGCGGVWVTGTHTERNLRICSEEHAQNLIKAINKAIELGWFEE